MNITIHHVDHGSTVNGPGERAVIWLQGCSIGRSLPCKGCFSPHTWDKNTGKQINIKKLAEEINKLNIRGVTFSGGEPLDQVRALIELIKLLNKRFDVMVFTGFEIEEILRDPEKFKILKYIDLLKSGRYNPTFHSDKFPWRGSSNQKIFYLSSKITRADEKFADVRVEIKISDSGTIRMTGFPSENLIKDVKGK